MREVIRTNTVHNVFELLNAAGFEFEDPETTVDSAIECASLLGKADFELINTRLCSDKSVTATVHFSKYPSGQIPVPIVTFVVDDNKYVVQFSKLHSHDLSSKDGISIDRC